MRLIGCEAGGDGLASGRHAATLAGGSAGVIHGMRTYLLQDGDGQTLETHSISAGLDYPGVGPEHSWLHDTGRASYRAVTDAEAMDAFSVLCRTEGIIPAIESAHALAGALQLGPELGPRRGAAGEPVRPRRQGRGHRGPLVRASGDRAGAMSAVSRRVRAGGRARTGRRSSATCPPASPRSRARSRRRTAMAEAGADIVEIGLPYSDPLMDGPVIQEATHRALAAGTRVADVLRTVEAVAGAGRADPGHDLLEPGRPLRRGRVRRGTWPPPGAAG